jgi:adenylate cyclase class IV
MRDMEVEYKYWADGFTKDDLYDIVMRSEDSLIDDGHIYAVSCDDYYINDDGSDSFIRFRKSMGSCELTLKAKQDGNVVRTEINIDVTGNNDMSVESFLLLGGYKKLFSIFKEAWIWRFKNCDVSLYTLADGRSVVEVEATAYTNDKEGVGIISKWESDNLALSLSDGSLIREPRSLFEIFKDESVTLS